VIDGSKAEMFFGKKDKDREQFEDPATRYGRILRNRKGKRESCREKPSFLARIFGSGHDSDFVYHED
jgi:hypothetical protein